jgi:pyridoxal 5'-phosphate synthase pdxS subunit
LLIVHLHQGLESPPHSCLGAPSATRRGHREIATFYDDPDVIATVSRGFGEAMIGIKVEDVPEPHRLAERGE